MKFHTDYVYTSREDKAKYVWLKYKSVLSSAEILDVGADECHLKKYINADTSYWGIGLGGNPDQQIDLEKETLPFDDNSYDCVLCLDVLEHIESLHSTFDELCRVSSKYVIISLPNAWASLATALVHGNMSGDQHLKYYGLPLEKPEDRHKWFFSSEEAQQFIHYRAKKNNMQVVQIDSTEVRQDRTSSITRMVLRLLKFKPELVDNLYTPSTIWAILEKSI